MVNEAQAANGATDACKAPWYGPEKSDSPESAIQGESIASCASGDLGVENDPELSRGPSNPQGISAIDGPADGENCSGTWFRSDSGWPSDGGGWWYRRYHMNDRGSVDGWTWTRTSPSVDDDTAFEFPPSESESDGELSSDGDEVVNECFLSNVVSLLACSQTSLEPQSILVNEDSTRLFVDLLCMRAIECYFTGAGTYQAQRAATRPGRTQNGMISVSIAWVTRASRWKNQEMTLSGSRGTCTRSIEDWCGLLDSTSDLSGPTRSELLDSGEISSAVDILARSPKGLRVAIGGLRGLFESNKETGERTFTYGRRLESPQILLESSLGENSEQELALSSGKKSDALDPFLEASLERVGVESIHNIDVARELGACPICLGEYRTAMVVRVLPCRHRVHKDCYDTFCREAGKLGCPLHKLTRLSESKLQTRLQEFPQPKS